MWAAIGDREMGQTFQGGRPECRTGGGQFARRRSVRPAGSSRRPAGCRTSPRRRRAPAAGHARDSCVRAAARHCAAPRDIARPTLAAGSSRTRIGTVLMNRPIIVSTPASSGGLPETVTPKTTSLVSVSRDNTSAQAICIRVLTVTPRDRVPSTSRSVASEGSRSSVVRGKPPAARRPRRPSRAKPTAGWGPSRPARCRRQTCWLASGSRLASQPM